MVRREAILCILAVGAMAASPACLAQSQRKVWRVGFLALGPEASSSRIADAFLTGMRELGYVEGRNLILERRYANGEFERLPRLAAELVLSESGRHRRGRVGGDRRGAKGDDDDPDRDGDARATPSAADS